MIKKLWSKFKKEWLYIYDKEEAYPTDSQENKSIKVHGDGHRKIETIHHHHHYGEDNGGFPGGI